MASPISLHKSPFLPNSSSLIKPKLAKRQSFALVHLPGPIRKGRVASALGDIRPAMDEYPEGIISGEWPENFSFVSYNDLLAYLDSQIITTDKMKPTSVLGDVMSRPVQVAMADQKLEEIEKHFAAISGLPVVDSDGKCIGVVSKKDKSKSPNGMESTIGQIMSSPAITLSLKNTVLDAAALMLKKKIHRIPVVNEQQRVVGIVTRTDIFRALECVKT